MTGVLGAGLREALPLVQPLALPLVFQQAANATRNGESNAHWLGQKMENIMGALLFVVISLWIIAVSLVSFSSGSEPGQATMYEPIQVSSVVAGRRKHDLKSYLRHVFCLPLHLLRSLQAPSLNSKKASSTERQFLHEKRLVFNDKVIEFLVIRRSMIYTSAVFSMVTVGIALREYLRELDMREAWLQQARLEGATGNVMRFEEFLLNYYPTRSIEDPEAWTQYTGMLMNGLLAKLMIQTSTADLIGAGIQVAGTLASCLLLWKALRQWSRFWDSSRVSLFSWALIMLVPFLITMIPVRVFIDWKFVTPVTNTFLEELTHHLGGESYDKAVEVVSTCRSLIRMKEQGLGMRMTEQIGRLCGMVEVMPDRHVTCCGAWSMVDIDFRPFHKTCAKVKTYLALGDGPHHERAVNASARMCEDYIIPLGEQHLQFGLGHSIQKMTVLKPLVQKMETGMEVGFALQNAVKGLKHILPICLAMAPAMLRGAMKVKVVAPQSTIPGMFVLILPWLFCPLSWAIYHTLYQLLADPWMLIGLLLVAFFPMWFFVLGTYHNITRPLTDEKVESLVRSIGTVSCTTNAIGYIFIGFIVVQHVRRVQNKDEFTRRSLEDDVIEMLLEKVQVFRWYNCLELVGNAFAKFTLTTLCGVDWMLTEIGKQRRYETLLVIAEKLAELEQEGPLNYPSELRTSIGRADMRAVAAQRQNRLDCVEWILFNEVPMRLEDKVEAEAMMQKGLDSIGGEGEKEEAEGSSFRSGRGVRLVPVVDAPQQLEDGGIEMSEVQSERWLPWSRPAPGSQGDGVEETAAGGEEEEGEVGGVYGRVHALHSRFMGGRRAHGMAGEASPAEVSAEASQRADTRRQLLLRMHQQLGFGFDDDVMEKLRAKEKKQREEDPNVAAFLGRGVSDARPRSVEAEDKRREGQEGDTGGSGEAAVVAGKSVQWGGRGGRGQSGAAPPGPGGQGYAAPPPSSSSRR